MLIYLLFGAAVVTALLQHWVPLLDGLLIIAVGAVFFILIETEKQMRLAFQDGEGG